MNTKPIVLLQPPPSVPTQPYSSLPSLTGFLRGRGFAVVQRDLGVEFLDELLTRSQVEKACARARLRAAAAQADAGEARFDSQAYLARFHGLVGFADHVAASVETAKAVMRAEDSFYDLPRYQWATDVLTLACEILSLPFFPETLSPHTYEPGVDFNWQSISDSGLDTSGTLFSDYFLTQVIEQTLDLDPLVIGISVTYHYQLVPGLRLGRLFKTIAPRAHVVIGGAFIQAIEQHIKWEQGFCRFADSYVVGEGESALESLALCIRDRLPLASVPNLVFFADGAPRWSDEKRLQSATELACPDFDGLPMDRYFSPESVLLVPSTRGCYWGRCAFCDVSCNTRSSYRRIPRDRFLGFLRELRKRYGARRFVFSDDAMPPVQMFELARFVERECPDVTWQTEARFEKTMTPDFVAQLRRGGCRQLIFGFESACQRILDLMAKNNTTEVDRRILRSCKENGIAFNLQCFLGFPGETRAEARSTVEFIKEHESQIASFGLGTFILHENTPVYEQPAEYGVEHVSVPIKKSLASSCDFVSTVGMSREEVVEVHQEALEELMPIFETRLRVFAGAAGAHSLLQLSRHELHELRAAWHELDSGSRLTLGDPDQITPVISGSLIFSAAPGELGEQGEYRAFSTRTGRQQQMTPSEYRLLRLCDGGRTAGDIGWLWAEQQADDLSGQVKHVAQALVMLEGLLQRELVGRAQDERAPVPAAPCDSGRALARS